MRWFLRHAWLRAKIVGHCDISDTNTFLEAKWNKKSIVYSFHIRIQNKLQLNNYKHSKIEQIDTE